MLTKANSNRGTRPSTQLIEATSIVKILNGKDVVKELSYWALWLAELAKIGEETTILRSSKKKWSQICGHSGSAVNSLTVALPPWVWVGMKNSRPIGFQR